MILLVIKGKEMFNQLVYNAIIPKKEREEREVSIKYGELFLHDGVNATASIEYLEGKHQSREQEQLSRDQGVFYNPKKGIKQILIKGRTKENDRESLLLTIERMKAELAKPEQQWLRVKENEREREWECVVSKFNLAEHNWNINWIEREIELQTFEYGRNPKPRILEQSINQEQTSISIERGGTAPSQLYWEYHIREGGGNFELSCGGNFIRIEREIQGGSILKMEGKNLTLDGEKIAFDGTYPRLEQVHENILIKTKTRGEIRIFYHLSYE